MDRKIRLHFALSQDPTNSEASSICRTNKASNIKTRAEKSLKSGYDSFITTSLPRLDLPTAICSALILGSGLMKLCRFLREADFGVGI